MDFQQNSSSKLQSSLIDNEKSSTEPRPSDTSKDSTLYYKEGLLILYQDKIQTQKTLIEKLKGQNHQYKDQLYNILEKLIEYETELTDNENRIYFDKNFVKNLELQLQKSMYTSAWLNNLIKDLLDQAQFEAGTFRFHEEYFDLIEVIENAFEIVRHSAQQKKITLIWELVHDRDHKKDSSKSLALYKMGNSSSQDPSQKSQYNSSDNQIKEVIVRQPLGKPSSFSLSKSRDDSLRENFNIDVSQKSLPSFVASDQPEIGRNSSNGQKYKDYHDLKKIFQNIYGDKNRYMQILLNFLDNAIKFTPKNKEISVKVVFKEEQKPTKFFYHPQSDQQQTIQEKPTSIQL